MSDDLLTRLRECEVSNAVLGLRSMANLLHEAADEIERLVACLADVHRALDGRHDSRPVIVLARKRQEELVGLRLQLERDARTYATMQAGMESQAELMDGLKQRVRTLEAEVARLKAGRFTEEEFQGLCHTFTADDRERFELGCREYQERLFGPGGGYND